MKWPTFTCAPPPATINQWIYYSVSQTINCQNNVVLIVKHIWTNAISVSLESVLPSASGKQGPIDTSHNSVQNNCLYSGFIFSGMHWIAISVYTNINQSEALFLAFGPYSKTVASPSSMTPCSTPQWLGPSAHVLLHLQSVSQILNFERIHLLEDRFIIHVNLHLLQETWIIISKNLISRFKSSSALCDNTVHIFNQVFYILY